jgi:hypothetical protein
MRLIRLLSVPAAAGLLVVAGMSSASAGEVTGNGKSTGAPSHTHSICAFSGLDDGSEGAVGGPGSAPQNWGQIPREFRTVLTAMGESPGAACNGHTGFFAGGH